ncbi:hypothetical protein HRbin19_00677 [bacterium HR19]|nr:hypothetical protein HRbin19_00677 [bacterium HR19]
MEERKNELTLPGTLLEQKIICAKIGKEIYGFKIEYLEEIIKMSRKKLVLPSALKHLKGIILLKGNIVPVIDILSLFEIGAVDDDIDTKIGIVVKVHGEKYICIIADDVFIETFSPASLAESPKIGIKYKEAIEGIGKSSKGIIIVLKPEEIIERHRTLSGIKLEEKLEQAKS